MTIYCEKITIAEIKVGSSLVKPSTGSVKNLGACIGFMRNFVCYSICINKICIVTLTTMYVKLNFVCYSIYMNKICSLYMQHIYASSQRNAEEI